MRRLIFYSVFVGIVVWFFFRPQPLVELGPGIKAPEEPFQVPVTPEKAFAQTFFAEGYLITPLAEFEMKGKILSRRTYSFGRPTDLPPIDLALGWGRMSDESIVKDLKVKQGIRFYFWKTRTGSPPIPIGEIISHSANMHMIPASEEVKAALLDTHRGEIVRLRGKLVEVLSPNDQWHWKSSLARDDTGGGACEVIWVEQFEVIEPKS